MTRNNNKQNNLIQTTTTTATTTNNNNKKQLATVRYLKEDLELLIQRLRNLQKQRQQTSVSNLEQFLKLVDEFNDKSSQQINLITILNSNETVLLLNQEVQLQLRQLQSSIKQICLQLNKNNTDSSKQLDIHLGQLSKSFNEFMHILDRINNQNSLSILKN